MRPFWMLAFAAAVLFSASTAFAQLTAPPAARGGGPRVASLEERLVNGLRATRPEQQAFLQQVVQEVEAGRLPAGLVNAVYKWAQGRFPLYPFPFFERGMRVEARRRGVNLPSVDLIIRSGRVVPVPLLAP